MRKRLVLGAAATFLVLTGAATGFALLTDDTRPTPHGPAWTHPVSADRALPTAAASGSSAPGTPVAGATGQPSARPSAAPSTGHGATRRSPAPSGPSSATTGNPDNPVDAEPDRFAPGPGPTDRPGPTGGGQPSPVPGRTIPIPGSGGH